MSHPPRAASLRAAASICLHLTILILIFGTASAKNSKKNEQRRVIVRYAPVYSRAVQSSHYQSMLLSQGVNLVSDLQKSHLAVLSGPAETVMAEALKIPGVESVEEDIILSAHIRPTATSAQFKQNCMYKDTTVGSSQKEVLPYGVQMVVGPDGNGPGPSSLLGSDVVVCILDTGIYTNHTDLKQNNFTGCTETSDEGSMCRFYPFNAPKEPHGTHVSGTIAATRGNGSGVVGILPSGVDIIGSNVLPGGGTGPLSLTLEALSLCEAEVDARKAQGKPARAVINMSFGTDERSSALESVLNRMYARGDILFVASAGNEQVSSPGQVIYPAGFDSAISVGAVNCNKQVAAFSQRNYQVSLVAPGVDTLSTTPPDKVAIAKLEARTALGFKSTLPVETVEHSGIGSIKAADVVDCGLGTSKCANAEGKACLIQRGTIAFGCKARNAQLGGCAAILLYNTENPPCTPLVGATLETQDCKYKGDSFPPTVALTQKDGKTLKSWTKKKTKVTLSVTKSTQTTNYKKYSGTSMAAPHVTGIAARIWADFPRCTNLDVRKALEDGAKNIGDVGKDINSGYGLVDLNGAYSMLQNMPCAQPEAPLVPAPAPAPEVILPPAPVPEPTPAVPVALLPDVVEQVFTAASVDPNLPSGAGIPLIPAAAPAPVFDLPVATVAAVAPVPAPVVDPMYTPQPLPVV